MPDNEILVDLKSGNEAVDKHVYKISNFGKVVNRFGRTLSVFEKHRFKKQDGTRYTKDDYLTVSLYDGSKHCNFAVHSGINIYMLMTNIGWIASIHIGIQNMKMMK